MLLKKINIDKLFSIIICIVAAIAVIGFFRPAVNINLDINGNKRQLSLSMESVFNRPENPFGNMDSDESSGILSRFSDMDLLDFSSETFKDVRATIIRSVGSYLISLILLIIIFILAIIGKLKKVSIILSAISFALLIYAGRTILSVQEPFMNGIVNNIENALGFLASFMNISDLLMIEIGLGGGYWLTVITICCMVLLKATRIIQNKLRKGS